MNEEHSKQATAECLIAELVHEFESDWQLGRGLAIEDYLRRMPPEIHGRATDELRRIQQQLRECSTLAPQEAGSEGCGAALGWANPEDRVPESISRYRVLRLLGRGAFGAVYECADAQLERNVAVKVFRADRSIDSSTLRSLLDEARRLAQLSHPNIVSVYDVGEENGRYFIVSQLIEGGTLAESLRRRAPLPLAEAVELTAQIAEGLHHVHLKGIVHRDLKPSNILIDSQRRPVIVDFGLAATEHQLLVEPPGTVGTRAYMAPEQFRGESHLVDARADVYSLGVILYEMLTNRRPFLADAHEQYREQVLNREPRPPRTINDAIPQRVEAVCLKCLRKDPAHRYTTALDVARELRRAIATPRRWTSPRLFAAIAVLLIAAGLSVGWLYSGRSRPAGNDASQFPKRETPLVQPPTSGSDNEDAAVQANVDAAEVGLPVQQIVLREGNPATWDIVHSGTAIRLVAEEPALWSIGRCEEREDLELAAQIFQPGWAGRIGFFFNFDGSDTDRVATHFQMIEIQRQPDGIHKLQHSFCVLPRRGTNNVNQFHLASVVLPAFQNTPKELLVHMHAGAVDRVVLDGIEYPSLVNARHPVLTSTAAELLRESASGLFGACCWSGSATVSEIRVNGATQKLSRGPVLSLPGASESGQERPQ